MMESRQIREAAQPHITIAIEDCEFATLRVTRRFMAYTAIERVDVSHLPCDVVSYCKWLEKAGNSNIP